MPNPSEPLLRIGRTDIYVYAGRPAGDITRSGADVLVSSAGTGASMSSGVSAAIRAAGGDSILSISRSTSTNWPIS